MLSHVTPWTVACQAPLSMEFSGNSVGVGSHSLLQGIFPIQGSTSVTLWTVVHGISLARIVEWVAISSSRGDLPRDPTCVSCVSCMAGGSGVKNPVSLLRISHGQRSLVGYGPWGCKNLDTTEASEYARFYMQVKINNGSDGWANII